MRRVSRTALADAALAVSSHDVGAVTTRDVRLARAIRDAAAALGIAPLL